jgi:DNA-binding transcriptional ArsR family regulator
MPFRELATSELASLLSVLAHPQRIRIVEELRRQEHDVNFLAEALAISHSRVSQHLALLRSHHLVETRRDGRHVYYHLSRPELASWLLNGLDFVEAELARNESVRDALSEARNAWGGE